MSVDDNYRIEIRFWDNALQFRLNGQHVGYDPLALFYEFEYNGMIIPLLFTHNNRNFSVKDLIIFYKEYGFEIAVDTYPNEEIFCVFV